MDITAERFTTTTKDKTPCIYAILNNNNFRVYVGESKRPIVRIEEHKRGLRNGTHQNKEMQEDFNKGHSFTFYRIKDYTEDDTETMRYYELECMNYLRENRIELYNTETDEQIKVLLKFNSKQWELYCLMERKRDEYYKKYFGCTFFQFKSYYHAAQRKGNTYYWEYKREYFYSRRKEEIEKEEQERIRKEKEKRKEFLKEHKKISFYIKKDTYQKLLSITDNPEKYINALIEKTIESKT